uniref:OTU domain-containing protein n=1 Tax=Spongospora subterranea TaxID=70186 RepID=A0A0H5QZ85_9EUKA|eukprot:CRZ07245.1 hypothetical protein [Spongospora subterranea]
MMRVRLKVGVFSPVHTLSCIILTSTSVYPYERRFQCGSEFVWGSPPLSHLPVIMSSEWAKFTIFENEGLCFQPIDVPGDGNCFYHALALSPLLPTNEMLQIREMICQFALGLGRFAAEDIVRLLHTFVALGPSSLVDIIATMRRPGSWATNIDIVLASLYFNVDIVCFSNLSPTIEVFRTSTFLENHLPNYNLSSPVSLFIFHHQYLRPLSPTTEAHRHRLNHYCLLQPLVQHAGRQIAPISNSPDASAAPICTTRKSFVQSSGLQWFQKPTSTASKKKGVSKSKSREKSVKLKKPKTMTAVAAANHAKNLAVVMKWPNLMGINQEEAAKHDAARMLELKRRKDRADCLINCHEFAVIELLLSSMIDRVEAILDDDTPVVISKTRSRLSGRPKEQTWEMYGLMIAFHLHPNLGGGDFGVFQTVFGNTVPSETMRSWLRKENIYKWVDLVQVANKEDVMRIVPESKRFLFQKGDNSSRLSEKILCKYVTKASSLSSKYVQKQLVFKTALVSAQKAAAMAKKDNMKIFSSSKRQRLPAAGVETLKNLGRPVKYPDQAEFAEKLIRSRFDHGDPVTFEQVLSSFRREFSCPVIFKYFQAVVQNDHCLRVWLRRLLDRISFSERAGTISQKIPTWRGRQQPEYAQPLCKMK